ncbi:hypothetical protein BUALT_Bualt19G0120200 [Buddleja alternifolia]|uniref:RRM domain-containing protein n=1 Tax=Buddleja alternifolia TaxID=168488 RepID=A0AAV6W6S8_9LAMI|nr:hypothetical protein BUALT_Bualt19G0120200 [Buddleja alternifolia]
MESPSENLMENDNNGSNEGSPGTPGSDISDGTADYFFFTQVLGPQVFREFRSRHNSRFQGPDWVQEILNGDEGRFYDQVRMTRPTFMALCNELVGKGLLSYSQSARVSVYEEVSCRGAYFGVHFSFLPLVLVVIYVWSNNMIVRSNAGDSRTKKSAEPEVIQKGIENCFLHTRRLKEIVFEFFSRAGKVGKDVKLIMDRNSRRSKGVGYIEFYDAMSVPMAIALSGHLFLGQPVMVKPSEAEKNLVQSTASAAGAGVAGPYGATDRKLYVGNLHFNMTEFQLRQIFEAFGPVELVQLPTDPETGHCKGFGFIQVVCATGTCKSGTKLNGKLEIAGRTIRYSIQALVSYIVFIDVSSVTDHVGAQDSGTKTADFDDDDGGGLALNAQSRAMLMAKLDRSGIASSVTGTLGVPALNGAASSQQAITMPINPTTVLPTPVLPGQVVPMVPEPIGVPSECLLLKNMFDPATEEDPEFDLDIRDDVQEECSKYGRVKHIYVDKNTAGYVYLRFESVEAASRAQQAMHHRWFARKLISAIFLVMCL